MPVLDTNDIEQVERELLAHWANFGQIPGGRLCESEDFVWTEAPVPHLPYNAVLRTRIRGEAEDRVRDVVKQFEHRGVRFLWIVHPSSSPGNLEQILQYQGLKLLARETCMVIDLTQARFDPRQRTGETVSYHVVKTSRELGEYEDLITEYWSLPRDSRAYVHMFTEQAFAAGDRGVWLLAYINKQPMGKVYLSLRCPGDTASLWGVYVRPAARGFGIGTGLTRLALQHAMALGRKRIFLVSTDMGRHIYTRLGFREICQLPVYANTSSLPALQGLQPA